MLNLNTQRTFLSPSLLLTCVLTLALSIFAFPISSAYAVTSAEKQAEADAVMKQIDSLQTELNAANTSYDEAVQKRDDALAAMDEAQDRIDAAEVRIGELQERLGERAITMYKTGGSTSLVDVMLGSTSFEEFLTAWDMLSRIADQDAELVEETKSVRAEAQAAHDEFALQEQTAADEMQKAADLKTQIETTQDALRAEAAKITAEVAELQAQEELQAEAARQAAAAAEAAEAARAAQNSGGGGGGGGGYTPGGSVVSGSGIFTHPLPGGVVSSGFGYRDFDGAFHKGVDLAAAEGTPYYAADSGTVIYATNDGGYNGGAGNWVVIAHGNGLVTKYMHSSATYVSPGQQVSRGQNIGAVGNTGNSFGAHLHFQVEVDGVAVNPFNYL